MPVEFKNIGPRLSPFLVVLLFAPYLSYAGENSIEKIRNQLSAVETHFKMMPVKSSCEVLLSDKIIFAERVSAVIGTIDGRNDRARAWLINRLQSALIILNSEKEALAQQIDKSRNARKILQALLELSLSDHRDLVKSRFEVAILLLLAKEKDETLLSEIVTWITYAKAWNRDALWDFLTLTISNYGSRPVAVIHSANLTYPADRLSRGYIGFPLGDIKSVSNLFGQIAAIFQRFQIDDIGLFEQISLYYISS